MLRRLENGAQEVTWPGDWTTFWTFVEDWGLIPDLAIRILALGYYSRALFGLNLYIISGKRSRSRQLELQRQFPQHYRDPSKVSSHHVTGRAADLGADFQLSNDQWEMIGLVAEQLGLRWGGRFRTPDRPHFDLPPS